MIKSISYILPVYNGANRLATDVKRLVEVLSQFSSHFQIVIANDGSLDATGDIAHELSARYRQVDQIDHSVQRGFELAIESGKRAARYESILVAVDGLIDENKIRDFAEGLQPRNTNSSIASIKEDQLIERLMKWGTALREHRLRQQSNTHAPSRTSPPPKYSSVPEKRLLQLSLSDLARAENRGT